MQNPRKKFQRVESVIILVVALGLLPLGVYTGYLGWIAYQEAATFRAAATLPSSGAVVGTFYKSDGPAEGAFLSPEHYPEVQGAVQYQVSREHHDDAGDGWTQTAVIEAERMPSLTLGHVGVQITPATRVLGHRQEVIRPLDGRERLKIEWTKGGSRFDPHAVPDRGDAYGSRNDLHAVGAIASR